MSVSTEVQRTLVKSAPELWTELSSPEALARHLGEFGEIHIIKTEPETKIEWKAEGASGVVQLKQSGWGTKVTLSVTRTSTIPEQPPTPEPEPASVAAPEPELEPEPAIVAEPEPIQAVEPDRGDVESEPSAAEPEPLAPHPEPQLGFFARLFRKRKAKPAAVVEHEATPSVTAERAAVPETEPEVEPEPVTEVVALAAPELIYPDPPAQPKASEPLEDLASELESLEEQIAAETAALLTGVLDSLGAAHHRPFSRG